MAKQDLLKRKQIKISKVAPKGMEAAVTKVEGRAKALGQDKPAKLKMVKKKGASVTFEGKDKKKYGTKQALIRANKAYDMKYRNYQPGDVLPDGTVKR